MENSLIPLSEAFEICRNLPPIEYLYLGIPNTPGVTLIVGKAKSGKSIFMENMAYALLDKDTSHFLGREIGTVDKIAILSYEEMLRNRTERQFKQLTTLVSNEKEHIIKKLYVFGENKDKTIKSAEEILVGLRPEVVFIDSLGKLADEPIEDSKNAQKLMDQLRNLSSKIQCPLILLHHTVKNNIMDSNDLSSVAGSRVIGQEADSIYSLSVDPVSRTRTLKPVALRYSGEENQELRFTIDNSCLLQVSAPPTIRFSIPLTQQRKDKVLHYICSSSNVKAKDVLHYLKNDLNLKKSSAYTELKRLNLQQDEKGCYICPKPPSIETDDTLSTQLDSSEREQ